MQSGCSPLGKSSNESRMKSNNFSVVYFKFAPLGGSIPARFNSFKTMSKTFAGPSTENGRVEIKLRSGNYQ